ncbi:MAG: hypothetical protein JST60_07135 [Chloroflexi bacterium SZAS-1]|nr:hypothetical protein [Chloroflexi bacterium SZAS-1]
MRFKNTPRNYYDVYWLLVDWLMDTNDMAIITILYITSIIGLPFIALGWSFAVVDISSGIGAIVFIIGYSALISFLYFMTKAIRANGLEPSQFIPGIAVYLLLSAHSPFRRDAIGFEEEDLRRLSRIAEIEQGSADWRGNVLNVIVIGISALVVSSTLQDENILAEIERALTTLASDNLAQTNDTWFSMIIFTLCGFGFTYLFYRIFRYIGTFLGTETANRIVLVACEDALFYIEHVHLQPGQVLTPEQRAAVAQQFGYQLVPQPRQRRSARSPMLETPTGGFEMLVPIKVGEYQQRALADAHQDRDE